MLGVALKHKKAFGKFEFNDKKICS